MENKSNDCCVYFDGDKHELVHGESNCCFKNVIVELNLPSEFIPMLQTMSPQELELFTVFLKDVTPILNEYAGDLLKALDDPRFKEALEKHQNTPEMKRLRGVKYS